MRRRILPMAVFVLAAVLPTAPQPSYGQQASTAQDQPIPLPSIAEKTQGMEKRDGFIPFYWDARTGKVWLEIDRFDEELLYYVSLPSGVGQNDIGLNRGELIRRRTDAIQQTLIVWDAFLEPGSDPNAMPRALGQLRERLEAHQPYAGAQRQADLRMVLKEILVAGAQTHPASQSALQADIDAFRVVVRMERIEQEEHFGAVPDSKRIADSHPEEERHRIPVRELLRRERAVVPVGAGVRVVLDREVSSGEPAARPEVRKA